jgi:hypothetical protein
MKNINMPSLIAVIPNLLAERRGRDIPGDYFHGLNATAYRRTNSAGGGQLGFTHWMTAAQLPLSISC